MPWFKVDDNLAFHAKVVMAGNAAMGLWVRAGAWSMQQLTDGRIPVQIARQIGTRTEIKRLIDAGLWAEEGDAYTFHDWSDRQPSKADVTRVAESKGMAGARGNHIRWHKRKGVTDPECDWCLKEAK